MGQPPTPDQWQQMDGATNAAAAEGAEVPPQMGSSGRPGVMGILLHTDPPLSVDDTQHKLGVSLPIAHYVVAARKALDAVTDAESGTGTTVIEHVIVGSVSLVTDMSEPEPEPEAETTELEPAGVIE